MDWIWYVIIILGVAAFIYFGAAGNGGVLFERTRPDRFHSSTLVSVLLGLNEQVVNELLELYKKEFGAGPARYARRTFHRWKAGDVQPATQTFNRFLLHLPKVMTYDMKCEILRHFMEEYAVKDEYQLDVTTDDWEAKLEPLIRQIIDKAFNTQLPPEIERQLTWLGDGDMVAAQSILRKSQTEEGRIMVSMLREEFRAMEVLFQNDLNPKVSHVLEFPYGTIKLNIRNAN